MSVARPRDYAYYAALWLVSLLFAAPVAWIVLSSFKTRSEMLAVPPKLIFWPTVANYIDLFRRNELLLQIFNSVVLSLGAVIIAVLVSFLAAFCFSRFKPRGTNFLMFLLLSIRMLPGPAVILPVYLMYAAFGWKDSHLWLILFYAMFSIPFSVWILKGFVDGVSVRYDETGLVNGGSWLHIIFKVVLPSSSASPTDAWCSISVARSPKDAIGKLPLTSGCRKPISEWRDVGDAGNRRRLHCL